MQEQQIHYATTSDGVRIAFTTRGKGRPLLFMVGPGGSSNVEAGTHGTGNPRMLTQKEGLSRNRMLVSLDLRGQGMSARGANDLSLAAYLRDIDAVVKRIGADRIDIMALTYGVPVAVAYSARNPGRVAHLILWHAMGVSGLSPLDQLSPALKLLLDSDWVTFTEVINHIWLGWEDGSGASESASMMRESTTAEGLKAQWEAVRQIDVTDEVEKVSCPTLVLHRRGVRGRRRASAIAAAIPNARMVTLEGDSLTTYMGDLETLLRVMDDFLGDGNEAEVPSPGDDVPSGTAVILFADIAGSTALTERLGDAAFRARARALDTALRNIIRDNAGTPIDGKLLGDGVLATFASASQAIAAALACGRAGHDAGLPLHLGLHAGDVIREEGNVFGGAVNIAARISALSAPGEVLVSQTVRDLARTSAGVSFEDRGEQSLKGVSEPVRVWAVVGGD
jgi:class 3 adenylate cyclase